MDASPTATRPAVAPWKWWIIWMLFLATVVNYLDRSSLTTASKHIMHDFRIDKVGYAKLESWFAVPYAVVLIVAGFLADRWSIRWLYAGALLVWSAAGFASGIVETAFQLQLCRAVLGAGEAFNWPCAVGTVKRILPRDSQGLGNGIFNSGMTLGAVMTPLLVLGTVGEHGEGWRRLFQAVGILGSLWVILWLVATRGDRGAEIDRPLRESRDASGIPFLRVFTLRKFWITCAIGFAANISWHFYRVWLPLHLDEDLLFDQKKSLAIQTAFFACADLGSIATGLIARRFARSSSSVERSRKIVTMIAALACLVATPILFRPGRWVMVPLYCVVGAGILGIFAMFYAHIQDIAPGHTSKCLGLIGASTWFVNAKLHPIVGEFAKNNSPAIGKFAPMILIAGFLPLVAAVITMWWPEPEPQAGPAFAAKA